MPYYHHCFNTPLIPKQVAQVLNEHIRSPRPTISDMFKAWFDLGAWFGRRIGMGRFLGRNTQN